MKTGIELINECCEKHNISPEGLVEAYEHFLKLIEEKLPLVFISKGVELIAEERQEQIEKHGFDITHDAEYYKEDELKLAALYCLTLDTRYYPENWGDWFDKKIKDKMIRLSTSEFQIEMFKIAGALLAAQIDLTISQTDK